MVFQLALPKARPSPVIPANDHDIDVTTEDENRALEENHAASRKSRAPNPRAVLATEYFQLKAGIHSFSPILTLTFGSSMKQVSREIHGLDEDGHYWERRPLCPTRVPILG